MINKKAIAQSALLLAAVLMIGFGIDQIQAEYVAEIKLRNINKEYILKRTRETDALQDEIRKTVLFWPVSGAGFKQAQRC